jgi:hypothetical protein
VRNCLRSGFDNNYFIGDISPYAPRAHRPYHNVTPGATSSGTRILRAAVLLLSVALYVEACSLPAVMLHTGESVYAKGLATSWKWNGRESLRGAELLFTGWFELLQGNFAVIANPLLWFSWLFFGSASIGALVNAH